jgi:predicted DNA-binding transcriptional regulator AlpA
MTMNQTINDRWLARAQVRDMTGTPYSTMNRWIDEGKFPKPIKVHGCNRWLESELREWMEQFRKAG